MKLEYDHTSTSHPFNLQVDIRDLCEIAQIYFENDLSDMILIFGSPNLEQNFRVRNDVADQF